MPTPNDYSNFQFPPNQNTQGGDFSPTADAPPAPEVSPGNYPNVGGGGYSDVNSQFTLRIEFATEEPSLPEILQAQVVPSIQRHADLNAVYGTSLKLLWVHIHGYVIPWPTLASLSPGTPSRLGI